MKRSIYCLVIIVLVMGLVLTACAKPPSPTPSPTEETYQFSFAGIFVEGSVLQDWCETTLRDKAAELSNGRINIKVSPVGVLGSVPEYLDMVGTGAVDIATLGIGYYGGRLALLETFTLPFVGENPWQGTELMSHFIRTAPELQAIWKRHNIHVLYMNLGERPAFETVKPISSIADIKGLKMRTMGGAQDYLVEALGGIPIMMPLGDTYLALQTGVIDGAIISTGVQMGFRLYEVAPYFLVPDATMVAPCSGPAFNADVWNSLPEDIRDIINQAAQQTLEYGNENMSTAHEVYAKEVEALGCTVIRMTEAETEELKAMVETPCREMWMKRNPAGRALLEEIMAWKEAHQAK